jgi:hypothetical protein
VQAALQRQMQALRENHIQHQTAARHGVVIGNSAIFA